jgi:hypothetical protein
MDASSGDDRPIVVTYYFPVEIEVRTVPVVEVRHEPVYVGEDPRPLIDEAFRAFAASLEQT